jgi:hypothetical protein
MSLRVEYPLGSISQEDAAQRLKAFGEYLQHKHGIQVTWAGDHASVRGKYTVVTIEGELGFEGGKAVFDGKDPGFLLRGKAKDYLRDKFSLYLDPTRTIDDLPRG